VELRSAEKRNRELSEIAFLNDICKWLQLLSSSTNYQTQCFVCICINDAFVWVMYGKKRKWKTLRHYSVQRYHTFWFASLILDVCNCIESADFTKCELFFFAVNMFSGMIYKIVCFSQKMFSMGYQVHAWSHILPTLIT
jgi:tryptophan-rich sensory protein